MSETIFTGDSVRTIGVIGTGSMGQALIGGWSRGNNKIVALVRDSPKYAHLESEFGVTVTEDPGLLTGCGVVVIAVKPQMLREKLSEFSPYISPSAIVISVAAGITIEFIGQFVRTTDQIIRAMPNTPSIIGRGVSGISGSSACTRASLEVARELMSAVGAVVEVPESEQNALAAVSGSGPAYVFYLAEYLIAGARELGLDSATANELVRQTLLGSAELLASATKSPIELRQQVTSPGGMTAAAMQVLDDSRVGPAVIAALVRGTERATELGST